MAKRKRLGGPLQDYLAPPPGAAAPIARVAGDAAASAAFDEVSRELTAARREGRLVLRLALDSVEAAWMMRDRAHPGDADDPDFAALLDSLRRHGQRSPIEVTEIGQGRHGLISGWRRLTALRQLHDATGEDRFATVLALLRQPASSEAAYVAMVEENEIRLGLSYYERARIVAKAVEAGVFATPRAALQSLFASASRAKRSKIGSFLEIHQRLGDTIRFPQALTERLGLALVRVLQADAGAGARLSALLQAARPERVEAEAALLADFIESETTPGPVPSPESGPESDPASRPTPDATVSSTAPAAPPRAAADGAGPASGAATAGPGPAREIRPGLYLAARGGTLLLSGPAVDPAFRARLEAWLRQTADS